MWCLHANFIKFEMMDQRLGFFFFYSTFIKCIFLGPFIFGLGHSMLSISSIVASRLQSYEIDGFNETTRYRNNLSHICQKKKKKIAVKQQWIDLLILRCDTYDIWCVSVQYSK